MSFINGEKIMGADLFGRKKATHSEQNILAVISQRRPEDINC